MSDEAIRLRLMSLFVLVCGAAIVWWWPTVSLPAEEAHLKVHFLDVGQGDAIFIESPTGVQVLIDGGPNAGVLEALSQQLSFFDRTIDVVLATHPDTDHVGGLVDVIERYEVGAVIMTENRGDSLAANAFADAVIAEGAAVTYARRGQRYDLGGGAVLEILFPETNPASLENNTASIIAQLQYGDVEFMLTGDAPKSIEEYLVLTHGAYLESDVLKVGHHGSRTSTSELFLAEVNPTFAVISAEKDSRYGHPHVEVTDALFNAGVVSYATAEVGTVTFVSDGVSVWVP